MALRPLRLSLRALLLALPLLHAVAALALDCGPKFREFFEAQRRSFETEELPPYDWSNFQSIGTSNRSLWEYQQKLGDSFKAFHKSPNPDDVWVDGGAGQMKAISDTAMDPNAPWMVGISKDNADPTGNRYDALHAKRPKVAVIVGKTFEEVSIPHGTVTLYTDLFGAFSYSKTPDVVMRNVLNQLKVGGRAYLHVADCRVS